MRAAVARVVLALETALALLWASHAWVTVRGVVIVGGPVHHATLLATYS